MPGFFAEQPAHRRLTYSLGFRPNMTAPARKKLAVWLTVLFLLAVFMGPGPGMALANRPVVWFGMPALYIWGVGCFFIEAGVVLAAFLFVWRDDDQKTGDQKTPTA